jgi:hypothetical protein
MANYGLPSLSGIVITYSNKYYSFSFENAKILNIEDPLKKSVLISTEDNDDDSVAIVYTSEGKNKPTIITFTIECKSKKMGEIAASYRDNKEKSDTDGTLEIVDFDGGVFTFNFAVLTADPVLRSIDSSNDVISYELIFHSKPVVRG